MRYRISHATEYRYEAPVGLCYNLARLIPRELPGQRLLSARLQVEPFPNDHWQGCDFFGNRTDYFSIQQPHDLLKVTAVSEVEVSPPQEDLFESGASLSWEAVREALRQDRSPAGLTALQFTLDSPMLASDEAVTAYARLSFPPGRPCAEAVAELMRRIFDDFTFDPAFSTVATPLHEVLEHRSGVCQDFAHLGIACLRSLGLAARYVSGYIETDPPPGRERLVGADASHAWFAVYQPGQGWSDYDPTNNQRPAQRHITVAWGRDYSDVTPLKGVAYGGGEHELHVAVDVLRLD